VGGQIPIIFLGDFGVKWDHVGNFTVGEKRDLESFQFGLKPHTATHCNTLQHRNNMRTENDLCN